MNTAVQTPAVAAVPARWYQRGYRLSISFSRLLAGRSSSRPQEPLMSLLVSRRM